MSDPARKMHDDAKMILAFGLAAFVPLLIWSLAQAYATVKEADRGCECPKPKASTILADR